LTADRLNRLKRIKHLYVTLSTISRNEVLIFRLASDDLRKEIDNLFNWSDTYRFLDLGENLRLRSLSRAQANLVEINQSLSSAQAKHFRNEKTVEIFEDRSSLLAIQNMNSEIESNIHDLLALNAVRDK
jgi:hypothetical protein